MVQTALLVLLRLGALAMLAPVTTYALTLSGTVYTDQGSTTAAAGVTVRAVVGTSTLTVVSTTTASDGSYTLSIAATSSLGAWATTSIPGNNDFWSSVTYGNGRFVAVRDCESGGGDCVMYSDDGITWATTSAAGDDDMWTSVTYGNGRFVAVGIAVYYGGDDAVMYSDDGITWATTSAAGDDDMWTSVTYGNGRFVAVGSVGEDGNTHLMVSDDGITWSPRSVVTGNVGFLAVSYGNGRFIAIDASGDQVVYSTDALVWSTSSISNDDWSSVTYGNGRFVAVSDSGDYRVMYSTDGITWATTSAAGNNDAWKSVTYGNGRFVAVAGSTDGDPCNQFGADDCVMYSTDGITWSTTSAAGNNDFWKSVVYGNGRFVAVGGNGDRVMYADAGVGPDTPITLWTEGGTPATTVLAGVTADGTITGVPLYGNTVVSLNATTSATTSVTDLGRLLFYDSTDNANILYTHPILGTTTLSAALYVATGTTVMTNRTTLRGNLTQAASGTLVASAPLRMDGRLATLSGSALNNLSDVTFGNSRVEWGERGTVITNPTTGTDRASSIVVTDGRVFITGERPSGGALGGYTYYVIALSASSGTQLWERTVDPTSGTDYSLAVTSNGDRVFVTGYRASGGPLGGTAYYTVALSATSGVQLWERTTDPTSGNDVAYGIATAGDRVFVTGYRASGGPLGGTAYYTVALSATSGVQLWEVTTDPTSSDDQAYAASAFGDRVFVTGNRASGGPLGGTAYYTVALSATSGVQLWEVTTDPTSDSDTTEDIAVNETTVFVTGWRASGGPLGGTAYYTVALSATSGTQLWENTTDPTSGFDRAFGITTTGNRVFVTGSPENGGPLGSFNYYTISLDADTGTQLWENLVDPTGGSDFANAIASDGVKVFVTGSYAFGQAYYTIALDATDGGLLDGLSTYSLTTNLSAANLLTELDVVFSVASVTLTTTGDITQQGTLTFSDGTLTSIGDISQQGTLTFSDSTLTTTGNIAQQGTLTFSDSTLVLDGTNQILTGTYVAESALPYVVVTGTAILNTAVATMTSLTIESGAALTAPTSTLELQGDFNQQGSFIASDTLVLEGQSKTIAGNFLDYPLNALILQNTNFRGFGEESSVTIDPTSGTDRAYAVTTNGTAVFVTGYRDSGGPLGGTAYYTVALDTLTGTQLWEVITDPTNSTDIAYGIATNGTAVFVTGYRASGGPLGGIAYYTVALSATSGAQLWERTTDPTNSTDIARAITVAGDRVFVTGYRASGGPLGGTAYYTVALDALTGTQLWEVITDPTNSTDIAYGIATNGTAVFVTGSRASGGPLGSDAYYTVALSATSGVQLWEATADPTSGSDDAYAITTAGDRVFVTGSRASGGPLGSDAYYTIALSATSGTQLWEATTDPTSSFDTAYAITIAGDRVFVTGDRNSGGPLGARAYYTVALSATSGVQLWENTTDPTTGQDYAHGIITNNDQVFVTGYRRSGGPLGEHAYYTIVLDIETGESWLSPSTVTFESSILANDFLNTDKVTIEAPVELTVDGNFYNDGQFDPQGGTLTLTGSTAEVRGDLTLVREGETTPAAGTAIVTGDYTYTGSDALVSTIAVGETGSLMLPTGVTTITGNLTNDGAIAEQGGAVRFDSRLATLGGSAPIAGLGNVTFGNSQIEFGTGGAVTTDPTSSNDGATDITTAGDRVFVTGYRASGGPLGGQAYYTVALSATSGAQLWEVTTDPTSSNDVATDITTAGDRVFVTGYRASGGALGGQAYYTVALSATSGAQLWEVTTDPTSSDDIAFAITTTADRVFVTGYRASGGPLGGTAYYTVALSATSGAQLWEVTTDPTSSDDIADAITTAGDRVFVTGDRASGGPLGGRAYYTVALSATSGAQLWEVTTDPTSSFDTVYGIATAGDRVFVTGYRWSGGPLGGNAYYTVALSATSGAQLWEATTDPTSSGDEARAITTAGDRVFVTGYRASGGPLGGNAYYTVALSATSGAQLWEATTDPTSSNDIAQAITTAGDRVFVTGYRASGGPLGGNAYYTVALSATDGLLLDGLSTYALTTDLTATDLTLEPGSTLTATSTTLTTTGDITQQGTLTLGDSIVVLAGDDQTLIGTYTTDSALPDVLVTGVATFATAVATMTSLTIEPTGSLTAPTSTLELRGDFAQQGSFSAPTTLLLEGAGRTVTGNLTDHPLADLILQNTSFTTFGDDSTVTTDPTSGTDRAYAITTAGDRVFVTGYRASGGLLGGLAYYTIALSATSGAQLWEATTDPTSSGDIAYGITTAGDRVFVTGYRASGGTLGGQAYYTIALSATSGAQLWERTTDPTSSNDVAYAITTTGDRVFVAGCRNCISGSSDYYIVALSATSGVQLWEATADPTSDTVFGITTVGDRVFVTGFRTSGGALGGNAYYTIALSATSGAQLWEATTDPTSSGDIAYGITTAGDRVFVTGYRASGGLLGGRAYYTVALSATSGAQLWEVTIDPTSGTDEGRAITAAGDHVFVTGRRASGGPLGGRAYYTIALSATSGAQLWEVTTDITGIDDEAYAITTAGDRVFVAGFRGEGGPLGGNAYYTILLDARTGLLWTNEQTITFTNPFVADNLTIAADSTLIAPPTWSLSGDLTVAADGSLTPAGSTLTLTGTDQALMHAAPLTLHGLTKVAAATSTLTFTAGETLTTTGPLTLTGTSTGYLSLVSSDPGTRWRLAPFGGRTVDWLMVSDSDNIHPATIVCYPNCLDAGNNLNWSFGASSSVFFASERDQRFYPGQGTTTLDTLSIIEGLEAAAITTTHDIHISIPTTTVDLRFAETEQSVVFGGTAAGKVAEAVSVSDVGALLTITVTEDFLPGDTLTISGVVVVPGTILSTTTSRLALATQGTSTITALDVYTIALTGALTLTDHPAGQVSGEFSVADMDDMAIFAFQAAPVATSSVLDALRLPAYNAAGVTPARLTNLRLYVDADASGTLTAGDSLVASGALALGSITGTVSFTTLSYVLATTTDFIVVADTASIPPGSRLSLALRASDVTAYSAGAPDTTNIVTAAVSTVTLARTSRGGAGNRLGSEPPPGDPPQSGGGGGVGEAITEDSGDVLVLTPGFLPPTTTGTPYDEWVSGLGATSSDGVYVSSDTLGARQSYGSFSFTIPSGDTITGLVVQLEASADSAGGQVAVALSWDGGVSTTTAYFTPLLTTTDTVYTLGGQNDDWGRTWSLADVETDNFRLRLIAQPDGNTIRVDAVAARVWHQATGGGGGAGDPLP